MDQLEKRITLRVKKGILFLIWLYSVSLVYFLFSFLILVLMATVCTSCGKSDIIHSRQDWNEVCGNCGLVLRQNIPTDEAEWQNSTGDGIKIIINR